MIETVTAQRGQAAHALLAFLAEAGVDAVLQDAPRDRFAETARETEERTRRVEPFAAPSPAPAALSREPADTAAPPPPPVEAGSFPTFAAALSPAEALAEARRRAAEAGDLGTLRDALAAFEGCSLKPTAKSLVFGEGDPNAAVMIVCGPPGREEDDGGATLVGRQGRLLAAMLASIGLERTNVRVAPIVPWRPPGDQAPRDADVEACLPFLQRQIALVAPKLLVCLGPLAGKTLTDSTEPIFRLRGRWSEQPLGPDQAGLPTTVLFAPDFLMKHPAQKAVAWRDLMAVRQRLDAATTG